MRLIDRSRLAARRTCQLVDCPEKYSLVLGGIVILREERPKDPQLRAPALERRILRYAQDDTKTGKRCWTFRPARHLRSTRVYVPTNIPTLDSIRRPVS